MAEDLGHVLDHFGPGPFVLVGHSAGGCLVRIGERVVIGANSVQSGLGLSKRRFDWLPRALPEDARRDLDRAGFTPGVARQSPAAGRHRGHRHLRCADRVGHAPPDAGRGQRPPGSAVRTRQARHRRALRPPRPITDLGLVAAEIIALLRDRFGRIALSPC
ncbi:alpha/beta fold hydrolase [Actinokineospora pegani]|uniref:alpha/beta fold hydrolase n=1 Tax=Actinokineospora pegani TaxID=2654637 RepID=UPI001F192816|nr:hypothetical protein [Actinokineospora pegani]